MVTFRLLLRLKDKSVILQKPDGSVVAGPLLGGKAVKGQGLMLAFGAKEEDSTLGGTEDGLGTGSYLVSHAEVMDNHVYQNVVVPPPRLTPLL